MDEWWNSLSFVLKVLYCIAAPSTMLLLIQTLLSMFGMHDDGGGHDFSDTSGIDFDTDVTGHGICMDSHHFVGCDHNIDGGNPGDFASMRMFTLQTVVTFLTVFSWSAIVMISSGMPNMIAGIIAFVLGFLTMALVAKIAQLSMKLAENGSTNLNNAIGEIGTVYIPCPPKNQGRGKVNVTVQGQLLELTAISTEDEVLKTGTSVRITDLHGDTLVVEKEN